MRIIALTLYLLAVSWNCYAAPFGDIEAEGDISANGNLVVDGTATTGATEATSAGGQIANYNNTSGSTDITMRYGYPGYGWYWLYEGSGSGNDNKHKLFSEGAGGTDVQVYEVTQDGVTIFSKSLSALNLSGTNTGDNTVCTSGAATTATTASTGDTATDFFDAGTIADARLETTIDRTIFNASDSVNVGGGYGSTGFTVQSTGNVYTDGDVTVGSSAGDPAGITIITPDGGVALGNWNGALVSIRGGTLRTDFGYNNGEGCEGATLDGGSLSIDSGLIVDGTSTLTGELQVAGGYGSTGVTIESDGDVSMDGDVTVGSSAGDPASITIITPDGEEGGTAFSRFVFGLPLRDRWWVS